MEIQNKEVVPKEHNYPTEKDFFTIHYEEYDGLLPIHSVRMSFALPFDDWCEFQKSNLFQELLEYLREQHKLSNQNVMIERLKS